MRIPVVRTLSALALSFAMLPPASAFNFGNMMNPNRWFNGNSNNYDDRYYDDRYGPPGPGYGYPGAPGYGGYGVPGYGPPGYAAPGYGVPAYGAPGYANPPATAPVPAYTPPAGSNSDQAAEIERLKKQVRELQQEKAGTTAPAYTPAPAGSSYTGHPISSWQTPMPSAGASGAGGSPATGGWNSTPAPTGSATSSWQPAGTTSSGWQPSNTGTVGTNPPAYGTSAPAGNFNTMSGQGARSNRPQSQYPGQQSYELTH